MPRNFDPKTAQTRVDRLWKLDAHFGAERGTNRVYLDEIVSDRIQLITGLQVVRDELQFAGPRDAQGGRDREACTADFGIPSVVTTLACTNCGDRIHHGETEHYHRVVASRFATLAEVGTLKPEAFSPTGGGTDDGATLAHVTWAHVLDEPLRRRLYDGNRESFVLCAFDLKTHVGRDHVDGANVYGLTRESSWREPRAACGAIVGTLQKYNERNDVHRRIRADLGEEAFALLSKQGVKSEEGIDITAAVAGAIVSVRGMLDTAHALRTEMDQRGLAHLTASMTVNRPDMPDMVMYLARATVFDGKIVTQGLGTDAARYSGRMIPLHDEKRLQLSYGGLSDLGFPIETETYAPRQSPTPGDIFA